MPGKMRVGLDGLHLPKTGESGCFPGKGKELHREPE